MRFTIISYTMVLIILFALLLLFAVSYRRSGKE